MESLAYLDKQVKHWLEHCENGLFFKIDVYLMLMMWFLRYYKKYFSKLPL